MTGQDIINDAKTRLHHEGGGGLTDSQYLDLLNEGYTDFMRYTESRERQTSVSVSALTPTASLPSDYLEMRMVRWVPNSRELISKAERNLDYDKLEWPYSVGLPENVIFWNYDELRVTPVPSSAGTLMFRYAYIPLALTLTSEPEAFEAHHETLVYFVCAMASFIYREYDNAKAFWDEYLKGRMLAEKQAREGQRTDDTLETQYPVTVFNYPMWDQNFRGWRTK